MTTSTTMNLSGPVFHVRGSTTYAWCYFYSDMLSTDPPDGLAAVVPYSALLPEGYETEPTIYIKKATARIYGVQTLNGGRIFMGKWVTGTAKYIDIVEAFEGRIQNSEDFGAWDMFLTAADELRFYGQTVEQAAGVNPVFSNPSAARQWSCGLWYSFATES